jgi:uncharacterized protein
MAKLDDKPFWKTVPLEKMDKQQWESLCDGCAKCCLQKLQDDETEEVFYTSVVCQYLDEGCNCTVYTERNVLVPECVWLKPEDVEEFFWLPNSCSYRLIHEGKDLPESHPLITGDKASTLNMGQSVRAILTVKDNEIEEDDWFDHIIDEKDLDLKIIAKG